MSTRCAQVKPAVAAAYRDTFEHLADELEKLDALIGLRAAAMRRAEPPAQDGPPLLDVLHDEAGHGEQRLENAEVNRVMSVRQRAIEARVAASVSQGVFLGLPRLARLFSLTPFETQAVLICLAPELSRAYEGLYADLQDDATRARPSIALILDLLCDTPARQWESRRFFAAQSRLAAAGILRVVDDPHNQPASSDLARFVMLDARIREFILGHGGTDGCFAGIARLHQPLTCAARTFVDPGVIADLIAVVKSTMRDSPGGGRAQQLVVHLHGPRGVGKRDLARCVCGALGISLLRVDTEALSALGADRDGCVRALFREGILTQSAILFANADLLCADADGVLLAKSIAHHQEMIGGLCFIAAERPWHAEGVFANAIVQSAQLAMPDAGLRKAAWEAALREACPGRAAQWAAELADRFRLTPGRIGEAVADAVIRCSVHGRPPGRDDLAAACRAQSCTRLGDVARRIQPRQTWDDLVVPAEKSAQLREICAHVRDNARVFGEWGFGAKASRGRGLSVLFTGPPGTGKTMAAEIIAGELGLDLYKIDLSGVVSKYIGETEKNLSRIFCEAENANAILFFDEADALFGKRTQISDAHDRYANIETSYLLQRMEEYDGIVILATNLRENIDDAFTRRIRFVVEFPFPDAASREAIWRTQVPAAAPIDTSVDFARLARRFAVCGGSIRNIVLTAAFAAAGNGGRIGMEHFIHGVKREFEKGGKVWDEDGAASLLPLERGSACVS